MLYCFVVVRVNSSLKYVKAQQSRQWRVCLSINGGHYDRRCQIIR